MTSITSPNYKTGVVGGLFGAGKTLAATEQLVHNLLSAFASRPDSDLYALQEALCKNEQDAARKLASSYSDISTLIQANKWQEASEAVDKLIHEKEGHLIQIFKTASQSLPLVIEPAVQTAINVFSDRFCAVPDPRLRDCISYLKDPNISTDKVVSSLQALLEGKEKIFERAPLSTEEETLLNQFKEDQKADLLSQVLTLLKTKEVASWGVAAKLILTTADVTKDILSELFGHGQGNQQTLEFLQLPVTFMNLSIPESDPEPVEPIDYAALIEQESAALSQRASCTITARLIVEGIGGLSLNPQTIETWGYDSFRIHAFAKLEEASILRSLCAKIAYFILSPIITFYTENLIENFKTYVVDLIQKNSKDRYEGLLASSISLINSHVTNLEQAYINISKVSSQEEGEIPERLLNHLSTPIHFKKQSFSQFCSTFTSILVSRMAPSFSLSGPIGRALDAVSVPEYFCLRYLNLILTPTTFLLKTLCNILLFIPEFALNFSVKWLIKFSINYFGVIEKLFSSYESAMQISADYTHPMTLLLLDKLKKAWTSLVTQSQEAKELSSPIRDKLKPLVRTFFAVLEDENAANSGLNALQNHLSHRSSSQWIADIGDYLIMQEADATTKTVDYIANLLHFLFQEEQLLEIVHQGLTVANQQMAGTSLPLSSQDVLQGQEEMLFMFNLFLNKAIRDALTSKIYPIEAQQKEADHQIEVLQTFVSQINSVERRSLLSQISLHLSRLEQVNLTKDTVDHLTLLYQELAQILKQPTIEDSVIQAFKEKVTSIQCKESSSFVQQIAPDILSNAYAQIAKRIKQVPSFVKKPYNWRGFVSQFAMAFIDQDG